MRICEEWRLEKGGASSQELPVLQQEPSEVPPEPGCLVLFKEPPLVANI